MKTGDENAAAGPILNREAAARQAGAACLGKGVRQRLLANAQNTMVQASNDTRAAHGPYRPGASERGVTPPRPLSATVRWRVGLVSFRTS